MAPQVTSTEGFRLSRRCTMLFNPDSVEINAVSRLHGPFGIGTDADTTAASRAKPVSSTISPANTPTAQSDQGNKGNKGNQLNLGTTTAPSDCHPAATSPAPASTV